MKKGIFILVLSSLLWIGACGKGADINPDAEGPTNRETPNQPAVTETVSGIVETIVGTDVTVDVTEGVVTGRVVFHMADVDGDAFKNLKEGDTIEVVFNGVVTDSIPPQATASDFSKK